MAKNNKERVFGRTEIHKHKLEKYSSSISIFFGVGLAVMLLFVGIGAASAGPTAIIHVGSQQQVGYTVCIDGSQSYSQGVVNKQVVNDIFEIKTHTWNFGDGSPEKSGEYFGTVTHVYNTPGTYTVTLTVTDYAGRSASTSKSVTVGTLPKVTVSGNNANAIKSAINSLGGKPGIVYFPAGKYYISSKIDIPSDVILEGAGMTKTQLRNTGTGNMFFITGNNVRITDIEYRGSDSPNNYGIWCSGRKNFYVDHCDIHNFKIAHSIAYYSSVTFEHNNIHDNYNPSGGWGYGAMVTGASYAMSRYNELYDNRHSIAAGGSGAEPGWNTGYDCIHNHIYEESFPVTRDVALDAHGGAQGRIRISDNVFENLPYGIGLADSWGEIRRNTFRNVGGYVCKLYKTSYNIPGAGIYNFHIDHNTITNCGTHWRILYATGDVYLNCRKINHLTPFTGKATWDDCVDVYGTIAGTVTDKDTGLGISGASVTANGYSDTDGTDNNGNYIIPNIPEGTYTVTASKAGYFPESKGNVEVLKDKTTTVNSQLREAPDLVGLLHFDEGSGTIAADSSGYGNDGILVNDNDLWVDGKLGKALDFDGVDDYVDCGNDPSLNIIDEITIMLWIKPAVAGEGGRNAGPVSKSIKGVEPGSWQVRYNAPSGGNYLGFQFNGNPEGSTWVSVKQDLTPEEWYHIAGTFDGTNIKCYLNGVETDTNQISALKGSSAPLLVGNDGWGNIFNGAIDEVRIYNRALTPEEIKADYEAGVNSTYPRYDVNADGIVDVLDITIVAQHLGETTNPPYPRYDVNEDGKVDDLDITIVEQHFGETTS